MDFSQAKDLMKLQQEAEKIKKELWNTHIEAEVDWVVITVDWEMKIVWTIIEDVNILKDQKKLESAITAAANKWLKKAQEIAMEKMKDVMPNMWGMWAGWPSLPWA